MIWVVLVVSAVLLGVTLYDVTQKQHAILRNFPIIGHFRYLFEAVGPELRQYIVTSNNEERPFSRDERRWVYSTAKRENSYFGFGTDNDLDRPANFVIVKHATFADVRTDWARDARRPESTDPAASDVQESLYAVPSAKVLGQARGRARAFRPESVVQISGMSFGSLSSAAVEALNRGAALAGCLHNTGEGGISPYHLHGGDLVWQLGTGYFGARADDGGFSLERFLDRVAAHPVRAVEIKLSQGAKPGLGGVLPAAKVTPEIAEIRGVPLGRDVISPSRHTAFRDVDEMLDFVELLAERSGLPIGIKSAVGEDGVWDELATAMESGTRGVDFIAVDGGEGGTGAAPLVFTDHVALPFTLGFSRVYRAFARRGIEDRVLFIGAGRLGFPETGLVAFALGCDVIAVAREAMMAAGCIQAQRCHTGHCPTGVATHTPWLVRGLDPTSKAARVANYVIALRKEFLQLSEACGQPHPALVTGRHIEILNVATQARDLYDVYGYEPGWGLPGSADQEGIRALMAGGPGALKG